MVTPRKIGEYVEWPLKPPLYFRPEQVTLPHPNLLDLNNSEIFVFPWSTPNSSRWWLQRMYKPYLISDPDRWINTMASMRQSTLREGGRGKGKIQCLVWEECWLSVYFPIKISWLLTHLLLLWLLTQCGVHYEVYIFFICK